MTVQPGPNASRWNSLPALEFASAASANFDLAFLALPSRPVRCGIALSAIPEEQGVIGFEEYPFRVRTVGLCNSHRVFWRSSEWSMLSVGEIKR